MACAVDSSESSPEQTQVKVFITSYTDEFFAERDLIRKEVLPAIKKWCENRKLTIVEHFIKWGGRHPDQRNVAELEKLQTSIENCYFSSIMPIFINITSSSLGWVPLWGDYSEEIVEDYQEAFGLLYEDLELLASAYREDNANSIFLLRDDSFIDNMKEQEKSTFALATSASQKSSGQQDKIRHKFPHGRIINYLPKYRGLDAKGKPHLAFDEGLRHSIIDFLEQRIAYDYCGEERSPSDNPRLAHQEFLQSRAKSVWGRENIVSQIEDYIEREERDIPLVVLGASGSGKTSIMCLAVKSVLSKIERGQLQGSSDSKDCNTSNKWRMFFHFVGAVPGSSSLEQMLKRLLKEMGVAKKNSNCAKDLDSAAQMCCSMLSNLNTEPLIIFVDGADQFTKEQGARTISWVPRKLAPKVRLVLGMVSDTEVHKALIERETKPTQICITPLDNTSKQCLIEDILGANQLAADQLRALLSKPVSENPLWLTLACQEVKLAASQSKASEKIANLPDSLVLLFEHLLQRLESGPRGDLHIGVLCLLEASAAGLNEYELRELLADGSSTIPPSQFEEKEETEEAEKDMNRKKEHLSDEVWKSIYNILQPFLRPFGDSREGRLDFYHRALSKAVRKRYFFTEVMDQDTTTGKTEKSRAYFFWHRKLAQFFRREHGDVGRMVEELPHHLANIDDKFHLAQCLCDWRVFDRLYHEEYSSQLMAYWRKVGPISEMISSYEVALKKFEEADAANEAAVSVRYEKVCRVTIQAGKHQDALELLKTAMKIEEKELGARPHRMVDLYSLMSEIYDEKLKLNDFVSRSQVPDLRKTIHYAKKSINIRKTLPGPYHKYKLGMSLMRLAFNMKSWDATGGGSELSGPDAVIEGNKYIDRALKIFLELNDMGHYAEALMTKGVLAPRGSMEQLKLYNQAMELCMQMYGELHILTSRLYINIGIVYEDNKDYKRSYQYFKKWARLSEEIMGPDHPKTLRAKGVLRESRYRRIAMELGEWVEDDMSMQEEEEEDERTESCEMEHSYDDTVSNLLIVSQEEATLEAALDGGDIPVTTTSTSARPTFNVVPLMPNTYMQQTNQSSNRVRLDRHRRQPANLDSNQRNRSLPEVPDSNQRQGASSGSRGDVVYRFDNFLRSLASIRDGNDPGDGTQPEAFRSAESSSSTSQRDPSFPHAADVQSALREHETFNQLILCNQGLTPNSSGDSLSGEVTNGYVPSEEEGEDNAAAVSDDDHEGHSDSENVYDDNFEDYDEHYILAGEGNVVAEELTTASGRDDEGEEPEILRLGDDGGDIGDQFITLDSADAQFLATVLGDNRFARDEDSELGEDNHTL